MNNHGQNTVEYVLLVVAVVVVMVTFLSLGGPYQQRLQNGLDQATVGAVDKIQNEINFYNNN